MNYKKLITESVNSLLKEASNELKPISEFEFADLGNASSEDINLGSTDGYDVVIGVGSNKYKAFEDAIGMLSMNGWDARGNEELVKILNDLAQAFKKETTDIFSDETYHIAMRVK